jgi:hypothetical protein
VELGRSEDLSVRLRHQNSHAMSIKRIIYSKAIRSKRLGLSIRSLAWNRHPLTSAEGIDASVLLGSMLQFVVDALCILRQSICRQDQLVLCHGVVFVRGTLIALNQLHSLRAAHLMTSPARVRMDEA